MKSSSVFTWVWEYLRIFDYFDSGFLLFAVGLAKSIFRLAFEL
jgi:hypothetical protein